LIRLEQNNNESVVSPLDATLFHFTRAMDSSRASMSGYGLSEDNDSETFEKCSILFKAKEGENFNHRNTLSILRIKI